MLARYFGGDRLVGLRGGIQTGRRWGGAKGRAKGGESKGRQKEPSCLTVSSKPHTKGGVNSDTKRPVISLVLATKSARKNHTKLNYTASNKFGLCKTEWAWDGTPEKNKALSLSLSGPIWLAP